MRYKTAILLLSRMKTIGVRTEPPHYAVYSQNLLNFYKSYKVMDVKIGGKRGERWREFSSSDEI